MTKLFKNSLLFFIPLVAMLVLFSNNAFAQKVTFSIGERVKVGNQYRVEIKGTVAQGQTLAFCGFSFQIGFNQNALNFAGLTDGDQLFNFQTLFPTLTSNQNLDPYSMGTVEATGGLPGTTSVPVNVTGEFSIGSVVFNIIDPTLMDDIVFSQPQFFYDNVMLYCNDGIGVAMPYGQVANGFWVVDPAPRCIGCQPCPPIDAPTLEPAAVNGRVATFNWSDVAGVAGYYLKYSKDNWTTTKYDTTIISADVISALPNGTYNWKVAAHNTDPNCIGTWADGTPFTVFVPDGCTTPADPTVLNAVPTVDAAGLTWTGTANHFVVEYAINANFTNAERVTPNPTATNATLANLQPSTHYFWRVKAVNTYETQLCESNFATGDFTTLCNTPAVPTGMASEQIATTSAIVRWTPADGVVYNQRYGTTLPLTGEGTLVTSPNTLSSLTPGTVYYWQVRAQNANNACTSEWTAAQNFQTVPLPPALTAPADAATCVPTPVTFSWQAVPNAQNYTLAYSIVGQAGTETVITGITGTERTINLDPNTNYTWKVKSFVGGIGSAFSAERTLTTSIPAPATTLPVNQATKVAYLPTLTWTAVPNIVDYDLQIATTMDFQNPTVNIESVNPTFTVTTPLANFTTYYWRVRAHGTACSSAWSEVASFKTLLTLNQPVLTTPANNANSVALSTTLGWNAAQYATAYNVEISTNPAFVTPDQYVVIGGTTLNVDLTKYNKTFYWRVQSKNLVENVTSDFTASFQFKTGIVPIPTLVAPADAAVVPVVPAPVLSWIAVPHVDRYVVVIAVIGTDITTQIETTSTSITVPADILGWNTAYEWFVIAAQEDNSTASRLWSFTTAAIPVPTLVAPTEAEAIDASLATVNFTWNAVAVAGSYDLEIANNANFTNSEVIPVSGTSYQHTQFALGTYYWRARTVVGTAFGAWSQPRSFSVVNASPLVVTFTPNTQTICAGEYKLLVAPQIDNGRANATYTYSWTPAQYVNSATIAQPWAINVPVGTTEFTLVVTESGTGRTATATQSIVALSQPSVNLNTTVIRKPIANSAVNLNSNISNPNAAYTYLWTDRTGAAIENPTNYVASTSTGLFRVQVIAHLGNCESLAKNMYVFLTARKDSDEDFTINGNSALFVKNPVTFGDVNLTAYFDQESTLEVSFVNVLGQEVAKFNRFGNQIVDETFDISNQPAGMYVVVVRGANGSVSGKIVKQ